APDPAAPQLSARDRGGRYEGRQGAPPGRDGRRSRQDRRQLAGRGRCNRSARRRARRVLVALGRGEPGGARRDQLDRLARGVSVRLAGGSAEGRVTRSWKNPRTGKTSSMNDVVE